MAGSQPVRLSHGSFEAGSQAAFSEMERTCA